MKYIKLIFAGLVFLFIEFIANYNSIKSGLSEVNKDFQFNKILIIIQNINYPISVIIILLFYIWYLNKINRDKVNFLSEIINEQAELIDSINLNVAYHSKEIEDLKKTTYNDNNPEPKMDLEQFIMEHKSESVRIDNKIEMKIGDTVWLYFFKSKHFPSSLFKAKFIKKKKEG